MNDWVIFAIFVLVISEIVFVIFRINFNNEHWVAHKFVAIICGSIIGLFHLLLLVENTLIGESSVFHWERLVYEFYVICSIAVFFILNYFVTKIIDYALKGDGDGE